MVKVRYKRDKETVYPKKLIRKTKGGNKNGNKRRS